MRKWAIIRWRSEANDRSTLHQEISTKYKAGASASLASREAIRYEEYHKRSPLIFGSAIE